MDACLDRYRIDPSKGDSGAAYALMSRLELFRLIDRMGLKPGEAAPAPGREETAPSLPTRAEAAAHLPSRRGRVPGHPLLVEAGGSCPDALPDAAAWTQEGRVLLSRAGWDGFEEGVKGLLAGSRPLRTTQAKRIHRYALSQGIEAEGTCFDAELAGYLLSPNASSYGLEELAGSYGVSLPALELPEQLTAPACPDGEEQLSLEPAGKKGEEAPHPLEKLAGQAAAFPRLADLMTQRLEEYGQMKLLREIELPLAQVLSSMEQEGVELDCQGLACLRPAAGRGHCPAPGGDLPSVGLPLQHQLAQAAGGGALCPPGAAPPRRRPRAATPPTPTCWRGCGPTIPLWTWCWSTAS